MVYNKQKGVALIVSMVFVLIFATLALALAQLANMNVRIADNQHDTAQALGNAQSGIEVIRYWMKGIAIPGSVANSDRLQYVISKLNSKISDSNSGMYASYDGTTSLGHIASVKLDSIGTNQFSVVLRQIDANQVQIDVTGNSGQAQKTIRFAYVLVKRGHSAFDFGVATKGPLSISGNVDLTGVNVAVEASVYIESENQDLALDLIGSSSIAGDVSIYNPDGYARLQGNCSIGGAKGAGAVSHVHAGVAKADFPVPVTSTFASYATSIIDENTNLSADATYTNVKIAANTNPSFSGKTNFRGILFIETPNQVTFTGGVTITGMVVGDGAMDNHTSSLNFSGTVDSYPVTVLPNTAEFAGIRNEKGTFIIAPGFDVSFGGNFKTVNGVIAATGVRFYGNAGGQIKGSIINYSPNVMSLSGNSDLFFDRSGTTENPAGFKPEMLVQYVAGSYTEL